MTDKLSPLLAPLFAPRPALRWSAPTDYHPAERHTARISGAAQYLDALKEWRDPEGFEPKESWLERKDRVKVEKKAAHEKRLREDSAKFDPHHHPEARGDPYRTLFVARLPYDVTRDELQREFGRFGRIDRIRIVENTQAAPDAPLKKRMRGYAFLVFAREEDMRAAYKETEGMRIRDRRIIVDVERGRTVATWKPRHLGGGMGGRGYSKMLPLRPSGPGFGWRGGFGGRGRGFGDRGRGFGGPRGYSGRGGPGYASNGWGAPEGAPSAPRGPRGGGYGGRFDDRYGRDSGFAGGANLEPLGRDRSMRTRDRDHDPRRDGGYGGRDRARDRDGGYGRDAYSRKRQHEPEGYHEEHRSTRRRF